MGAPKHGRRTRASARALLLTLVVLTVAGVGLGACGGGSSGASFEEPTGAPIGTVAIQAGNLFFKPKKVVIPKPGVYTVRLTNTQSGTHTLVFGDKVKGFKLDVSGSGSSQEKKLQLNTGTYTFWCDVPGHRSAGMQGTITVR